MINWLNFKYYSFSFFVRSLLIYFLLEGEGLLLTHVYTSKPLLYFFYSILAYCDLQCMKSKSTDTCSRATAVTSRYRYCGFSFRIPSQMPSLEWLKFMYILLPPYHKPIPTFRSISPSRRIKGRWEIRFKAARTLCSIASQIYTTPSKLISIAIPFLRSHLILR